MSRVPPPGRPSTCTRSSRSPLRPAGSDRKVPSSAWNPVVSASARTPAVSPSTSPARVTRAVPARATAAWTSPPGPGRSASITRLPDWSVESSTVQRSAPRVTCSDSEAEGAPSAGRRASSWTSPRTRSQRSPPRAPADQKASPPRPRTSTRCCTGWARTARTRSETAGTAPPWDVPGKGRQRSLPRHPRRGDGSTGYRRRVNEARRRLGSDQTTRAADLLDRLVVLDVEGAGAFLEVLQARPGLAIDLVVDVEVLLHHCEDLLPDHVVRGEDFLDVPADEEELDHLVDDVLDSLVAHLEAADVGHLALHLVELAVVVAPALERLPGRLVHALLVGEVLAHDGREVHLGVGDPHRLDLDVPVLHQQLDRLAGDDGNHLGIKPHKPSWVRTCPRRLTAGVARGSPRYTSPGPPLRNENRGIFSGSSAGGRSSRKGRAAADCGFSRGRIRPGRTAGASPDGAASHAPLGLDTALAVGGGVLERGLPHRVLVDLALGDLSPQLALGRVEVGVDPLGQRRPEASLRGQLLDARLPDPLQRPECAEERLLPPLSHPRDVLEHAPEIPPAHQL